MTSNNKGSNNKGSSNKHRKPWDKLPEESATAYEAFTNYIEMPASERSQKKMVAKYYEGSVAKLSWVSQWSAKYNWVSRAGKYEEWRQGTRIEIQLERIERAQEAISDELLPMIREYIKGTLEGDLTGPQVTAFKDLLDRAGLKVIEEHRVQVSNSMKADDLDKIVGITRIDEDDDDDDQE